MAPNIIPEHLPCSNVKDSIMGPNSTPRIVNKLILPVEDKPMKEIIKNKITINYCAHIKKVN